jgi:hypothetical protein
VHEFNPFTEQVAVRYFVGREDELKNFRTDLSGLREKMPNHQFVAGVNGSGKTWYLAKLVEIAQAEGFVAAMPTLDAQSLARLHIDSVLRAVVAAIAQRVGGVPLLDDWDKGADSTYFQHPRSSDVQSDRIRHDFEVLSNLLSEAHIVGAVICIDEGQRIDGRAMSALKNALQHVNSFLVVLSVRLVSDNGGAAAAGRLYLETKAVNEAEGDVGAARFYVSGVSLGPFRTDAEVEACIRRRLEGHTINFSDDVVARIARLSGRVPKTIITISNAVYDAAQKERATSADVAVLNSSFLSLNGAQFAAAAALVEGMTQAARMAIGALVQLRAPASASDIAQHLYPTVTPSMRAGLVEAVEAGLSRVSSLGGLCKQTDAKFEISTPVDAYALELALGRL